MNTLGYIFIIAGAVLGAAILMVAAFAGQGRSNPDLMDRNPNYKANPLMGAEERRIYVILKSAVSKIYPAGACVFAQVPCIEFIEGEDTMAMGLVRHKRADFVITDDKMNVLAVVEMQGAARWGRGTAIAGRVEGSDLIKQHALKSAGIPFFELPEAASVDAIWGILRGEVS